MNIAELLKDCPSGMELDCTSYGGVVTFEQITDSPAYPIIIKIEYEDAYFTEGLTKYGQTCTTPYNKCVIFPKGKTTWEGFQRPFKDGDVVITKNKNHIFIFKGDIRHNGHYYTGMCYFGVDLEEGRMFKEGFWNFTRLATEEEKQKLFDAIKANGYKWNAETKTLEKLEVNKFDITTLNAFERVLVRQNDYGKWGIDFFGFYAEGFYYTTGSAIYVQCVPYKDNEHLTGTTNDCDEYFKTWE